MTIEPPPSAAIRETWRKKAGRARVTKRSGWHYGKVFDIDPQERVLDLGPGKSDYAPDNVVRLDNIFGGKHVPAKGKNLAGIFQELPFADNSFDRVVASFSFYWLREGAGLAISEALRVLRPDGELQVFPAKTGDKPLATQLKAEKVATMTRHFPTKNALIAAMTAGTAEAAIGTIDNSGLLGPANVLGASALAAAIIFGAQRDSTLTIHNNQLPPDATALAENADRIAHAFNFMKGKYESELSQAQSISAG